MEQLDLFDDLVPVQRYLTAWSEKERAHRLNKKTPDRPPGKSRVEKTGVMRLSASGISEGAPNPHQAGGIRK